MSHKTHRHMSQASTSSAGAGAPLTAEIIFKMVAEGQLTPQQGQEKMAELQKAAKKTLTYKISPKGAISFYGLRRMPITLYIEELQKIIESTSTPEWESFLQDNRKKLSTKSSTERED